MRFSLVAVCAAAVCVAAGCASAGTTPPTAGTLDAVRTTSPATTSSVPPTPSASAAVSTPIASSSAEPTAAFPSGYPKVVAVRSLPNQVRNWYQMKGTAKAVQLAPGVWTPLQDGAAVEDAVEAGVVDGFCSSIKAFERQYRNGRAYPGACW